MDNFIAWHQDAPFAKRVLATVGLLGVGGMIIFLLSLAFGAWAYSIIPLVLVAIFIEAFISIGRI